jgi:Xaa-Pro aminopeptidase
MSVSTESLVSSDQTDNQPGSAPPAPDRRADVDAKHNLIIPVFQKAGCDGLLILDPDNFGWLSSGAMARGVVNPAEMPALYFSAEGRWVLAGNADSQRLFDEELDGLGFQLKEWPWHWGRAQLLADLCQGRTVACDQPCGECQPVGDQLAVLRRTLTPYDRACYRALGAIIGHALEATCRALTAGVTEREAAGQLSHRLMHRGVLPVMVGVAADGRSRRYRHHGFTAVPVKTYCVLSATGRKYGLCITASRSVSFGPPPPEFRQEHNTVCKVTATYVASTWPDAVPREILTIGRRVYLVSGAEHEWLLGPQGYVTGRAPVELALMPPTEELFQPGWAVAWTPSVGAAVCSDTFLVMDQGPENVTPSDSWPLKRIRIQGADFFRPDILQR